VGPEDPLAKGVVDALQEELGIPCVGPTQALAKLESSKAFTRRLVSEYGIPANPEYRVFEDLRGLDEYLKKLGEYVVKPDGLTGGKGVKLSGAHLHSVQEAVDYCRELLRDHPAVVIEEKLDGEEFSLQSFCDGTEVKDMIVVQDHKRACEGDSGPNTGGMGSYTCENHSLPFLLPKHLEAASAINKAVAGALLKKTGQKYKGILYGGFMAARRGIVLLEYNVRFGDPETLNVLSLLKTDFVDVCEAIIEEKLKDLPVTFEKKATVCKYIVPDGYPDNPVKGKRIDLSKVPQESDKLKIYHAALDRRGPDFYLSGSRAIAFVGIGKNLSEAEAIAEEAANAVRGPVYHRKDIGTKQLIERRIQHIQSLVDASKHEELPLPACG
jgi:phosphoribosylamine--glycine ligase